MSEGYLLRDKYALIATSRIGECTPIWPDVRAALLSLQILTVGGLDLSEREASAVAPRSMPWGEVPRNSDRERQQKINELNASHETGLRQMSTGVRGDGISTSAPCDDRRLAVADTELHSLVG